MKVIKGMGFWLGSLAAAILIGTLAILAAYSLPVGRMKKHVAKSSSIFDVEEAHPELITGFAFTRLDNFTDSIMLGIAMYDQEGSLVEKAMSNYRMYSDELSVVKSTSHYANNVKEEYYAKPYPRYWHGYLLYLKPLLLFFTYGEIRILNGLLQTALLAGVIKLFLDSQLKNYLFAYIVAILFINPMVTALSLQYSSLYYLILLLTIAWLVLLKKGLLNFRRIGMLAFVTGCVTSYFDFLTYPIVGLGFLLILCLDTYGAELEKIWDYLKYTALWGYGYAGMWAGKWLAGSVLLQKNMFADGFAQVAKRAAGEGGRLAGIGKNLDVYGDEIFVGLAILVLGYGIYGLIRMRVKSGILFNVQTGVYLAAALLPFGWMFLASEHSERHFWFVHRGFSVTLFALLSLYAWIKKQKRSFL